MDQTFVLLHALLIPIQPQLLLHLAVVLHSGPMINGVMMKTTTQAAILMVELVAIMTSVDGTPIARYPILIYSLSLTPV